MEKIIYFEINKETYKISLVTDIVWKFVEGGIEPSGWQPVGYRREPYEEPKV